LDVQKGRGVVPDLSLAIMMAPGKTPSFTACSNFSSKEGVMIVIPFDVCERRSGRSIVLLVFDKHVHGYVVLIRALIDACLGIVDRGPPWVGAID
jgi:hypothetical protein